jgi:hypothetical protein
MIKLDINTKQAEKVKKLGGLLLPDGKTWVIPDGVKHINRWKMWLPNEEGFIVQRPYFVLRAKRSCHKCGKETNVVQLGGKNGQQAIFKNGDTVTWRRWEGYPICFTDVTYLDDEVAASLQSNYPFFKFMRSKGLRQKIWGSTCVHCGALQEDDDEYRCDLNALHPGIWEAGLEIRIIYFPLQFDYYIEGSEIFDTLIGNIMEGR